MASLQLDQLMEAPNLPILIEEAQAALRAEAQKRQIFYNTITEDQKAEFINGEVIMHSPVKERHWTAVGNLYRLLSAYAIKHKLGRVASEKAMITLTRNDYEPDICFWKAEKADTFTSEQMQYPAPDFIVEVLSKGTAKRDRGVKFTDYAAHGVGEYWLVNPGKQTVEQYTLDPEMEEYELAGTFAGADFIVSRQIRDFRIPVQAMFDERISLETLISLL
ncbi:Uma2 family endonuclease [Rudanella lutea]|uniref:Uma2 family endonuclease n=1 Tax=Rudanella lutea TaxID=451374 RepID=UPI000480E779|nr:Uma2 family endonuclease [Rudanella lutea]